MTGADNPHYRCLSLGAGVQSTAVLLMSLAGELPPLDAAIFADTQAEPTRVYRHLDMLRARCADAGLPLHVVTAGDLRESALNLETRSGGIPVFIRGADGNQGTVRRHCTADFKVAAINRQLRAIRAGRHVEQWFGISLDEIGRMRTSDQRWSTFAYPLVDRRMTRWDCRRWLADHGVDAPRSACYFCPYHDNDEWRRLRDHEPAEFAKAVAFEADLQRVHQSGHARAYRGTPYLHRSMIPLADVDLTTPADHGQLNLFDQECAGMCGV